MKITWNYSCVLLRIIEEKIYTKMGIVQVLWISKCWLRSWCLYQLELDSFCYNHQSLNLKWTTKLHWDGIGFWEISYLDYSSFAEIYLMKFYSFFCDFQNKMSAISIDPNNYKLSDKTGTLTAQGEFFYWNFGNLTVIFWIFYSNLCGKSIFPTKN
jgi:hypothetical protein